MTTLKEQPLLRGTAEEANATVMVDEQVFSANDMFEAFKHGREFEQLENVGCFDIDYGNYDEKHWPFWEWLKAQHWGPK